MQLHLDLPRPAGRRSVLILSPRTCQWSGAGLMGLARHLGQQLCEPVLLVDACPLNPEISQLLGCAELPGWSDLLADPNYSAADVTLPTSSDHVSFLPAGRHSVTGAGGEGLAQRASGLRESYDFILFAGGGVLDGFTSLELLAEVGCVLLLVAEGETRIEDLRAAKQVLGLWRAPDVRIVLTTPSRESVDVLQPPEILPVPADWHTAKAKTRGLKTDLS
jgi:MinD-like ATPase involved in chromosome partitioning or flagellar assembly